MKETVDAIVVENLAKVFGGVTAVNNLSFRIPPGQTIGLLGGNGAGKTTTISMLLGLVLPSRGSIYIHGHDMVRRPNSALHLMNFESPYVDLPKRLTVQQNLTVYAHLYRVSGIKERIARLSEELDLKDLLKRQFGTLSAGQKTRVGLAKSLINTPKVLLLDEPTASLDPYTADWIRTYLEDYQTRERATILLASHNMPEVERLCVHVLMMDKGTVVDEGAPKDLISKYGRETMEEVFLDIARGRETPPSVSNALERPPATIGDSPAGDDGETDNKQKSPG